jgi:hypothetical protein
MRLENMNHVSSKQLLQASYFRRTIHEISADVASLQSVVDGCKIIWKRKRARSEYGFGVQYEAIAQPVSFPER